MIASITPFSAFRFASYMFVVLALLCAGLPARGQSAGMDECSGGTYYLVAFPDTTTNAYDARFPAQVIRTNTAAFNLYIYSPVDQVIDVGRINGAGLKISLTGGQIYELDLKQIGVPLVTVINTPQTNVVKVESAYPVIVYGYMQTAFGAEAYTPIPVESWGTEYYAATWPGEIVRDVYPEGQTSYRAVPKEAPGEILIVACYDNTQVRISPKSTLKGCAGCTQVTLKAGEVYMVQAPVDTSAGAERQPDLAGTFIQSSKRIGVVTGNTRVMHNPGVKPALAGNSFRNLAIEWIPPVEQLGTEFAFTPTWDDRRQRLGLDSAEARDVELVRIFGTSENDADVSWRGNLGEEMPTVKTPLKAGEFTHEMIDLPVPRYFRTTQPAMAFSSPNAVVKFNGTTTWGDYVGGMYLSWSTYMTELVPREQWTSFAPLRAPSLPNTMVHYLNLVTDSLSQFKVYYRQGTSPRQVFPFNRGSVPGSDLIWGSISLSKGVDYFIEGDKGARFTGHVYGSYRGQEQYRPGGSPAEYEEDVALMYGFPLAPSRCALALPDDYEIETTQECEVMLIEIKAKNNPASGIRSIALLADSSENIRLEFVQPANPIDLTSQKVVEAKLRLVAINPLRDGKAVVIVRDRTRESRRWRVEYRWEAERTEVDPVELDFGEVTINTPAGERMVTITNPLPTKSVVVKRLSFVFGTEGFVIRRTVPNFNWRGNTDSVVLEPGDSLRVWIDITPTEERMYEDSLRVQLGCTAQTIPVKAATALPCIFVDDLDFGTMNVGEMRSLDLEICNKGRGNVTLLDPWVMWLQTQASEMGFEVAPGEIAKLSAQGDLRKDECRKIRVSFTASGLGPHRTVARFFANTRDCRDTSIWRANVIEPGPQIDSYDWRKRWLSENACTKNPTENYEVEIQARNSGDVPFEVVSLTIENDPDGVFGIAATDIAPGMIMNPSDVRTIAVSFDPREEKVYYSPFPATICMKCKTTVDGKDTILKICGSLEGIGIESYATITDQSFGRIEYTGPASVNVPSSVTITAEGTRPVNIDQLVINPGTHFEFDATWLAANAWAAPGGTTLTLDPDGIIAPKELTVNLAFVPKDNIPPDKRATIDIIGDFAYDGCSITDSAGNLDGQVFRLDADIEGFDFGTILTCYERDGYITVRNIGSEPVRIVSIGGVAPVSMAPFFTVNSPTVVQLPYTISPSDSVRIPVRFSPNGAAAYGASVDVTVTNMDGTREIAILNAPLSGTAMTVTATMSIKDDHRGSPGTAVEVPISLDSEVDSAMVRELILSLDYDGDVLGLGNIELADLFPPGEGWVFEIIDKRPGSLTVRIFNTAGRYVTGTGHALKLEFFPLKGEKDATDIAFNIIPIVFGENNNGCVEITTDPGYFVVDPDGGTTTEKKVSLVDITPNPLKNSATITFRVGEKNRVRIGVYSADGRRVALLLDEMREKGTYDIEWDATNLITGAYYVQIKAGDESDSKGVRVLK